MLLVLASRYDESARALVAAWADHPVRLLTPADLSRAGWRYSSCCPQSGTAVIGAQSIPVREISGVLTRLPSVYENDLIDMAAEDRAYAAVEMSAFLLAWLAALRCPVVNRPTPTCLSGPYWRRERWLYEASRAGIPVAAYSRDSRKPESEEDWYALPPGGAEVTVIGDRCVGDVDASLQDQARRMARLAGVELLAVQFTAAERGALVAGAHTWPNLGGIAVRAALLEYLRAARSGVAA